MAASNSIPTFEDLFFWSRVAKVSDGCWEWTAARFPSGYGKVAIPRTNGGKQELEGAHRIAWLLTNGPVPDGLFVLHKCDNRPCCRPDHLFLGTHQENMADMVAKGRSAAQLRRKDPRAYQASANRRFEPAAIVEIRGRAAAGESYRSIARSIGIDHSCIRGIVARRTYADVV